jgi:hypothetical protein
MTDADDIAIAWDALRRGTPVVTRDGTQIGTVREVHNNVREHIFDGIVIDTQDGRRFVDAPEVARMTERQVLLTIDAAHVASLPRRESGMARMRRRLGL